MIVIAYVRADGTIFMPEPGCKLMAFEIPDDVPMTMVGEVALPAEPPVKEPETPIGSEPQPEPEPEPEPEPQPAYVDLAPTWSSKPTDMRLRVPKGGIARGTRVGEVVGEFVHTAIHRGSTEGYVALEAHSGPIDNGYFSVPTSNQRRNLRLDKALSGTKAGYSIRVEQRDGSTGRADHVFVIPVVP